jgi:hypothetical protein
MESLVQSLDELMLRLAYIQRREVDTLPGLSYLVLQYTRISPELAPICQE